MKKLACLLLLPTLALANDQCVLQDRTVSRGSVTIAERADIRTEVVPSHAGGRRCMVNFRARIGATWHTAFGEYEWPGDRPREEACAVALKRAEDSVKERVGSSQVISEKTLICNDNPDLKTLRRTNPGTIGDLSQFRPHPEYPREFWHNGAPCRLFLDSTFTGSDIRTYQGVICRVHDSKWVVVDKF
jgi:hypothetical protein